MENEEKCLAWFPAPYLEPCDGDEEEDDDFDASSYESKSINPSINKIKINNFFYQ